MQTEQRKEARSAVTWPIHASGGHTHLIGTQVSDISEAGLFVKGLGDEALPAPGTRLRLTIFPRGIGTGVEAAGTVRWSGESRVHHCQGLGVAFDDPVFAKSLVEEARSQAS